MTLSHIEDSATGHPRSHVARQVYVLCRNETVVVSLANVPDISFKVVQCGYYS